MGSSKEYRDAPRQAQIPAPPNLLEVRNQLVGQVKEREVPSISVGVVQDGSVVWMESIGWANREANIAAMPETRYFVASVSKSLTSTAVVELISQGRIQRRDPVKPLLGDALPVTGYPLDDVQVGHLMGHTSGIPHLWHYEYPDRPETMAKGKELLRAYGFRAFPAGSHYHYSNLGIELLSEVIQRAEGMDFQSAMSGLLFGPLGMKHTKWENWLGEAGTVRGYDGTGTAIGYSYRMGPAGGAGFFASLADLTRYCEFHLGGIVDSGLKDSTRVTDALRDFPKGFYLNGWGVVRTPVGPVLLSDGEAAGATAAIVLAPEQQLGVVVLCNQTGGPSLPTAFGVLGSYDTALVEAFEEAVAAIESEISEPGSLDKTRYVGVLHYKEQLLTAQLERGEQKPGRLRIGEEIFDLGETNWEWGSMTSLLDGSRWEGVERPDGHQLTLRLWGSQTGISGILMEQFIEDRPSSGKPYFIEMH